MEVLTYVPACSVARKRYCEMCALCTVRLMLEKAFATHVKYVKRIASLQIHRVFHQIMILYHSQMNKGDDGNGGDDDDDDNENSDDNDDNSDNEDE